MDVHSDKEGYDPKLTHYMYNNRTTGASVQENYRKSTVKVVRSCCDNARGAL